MKWCNTRVQCNISLSYHLIKVEPHVFLNVLPSATPPHILDGFNCSFSEMPNSALAFGRNCAAGKGETSVVSSTFFYQIQHGVNGRWYHLSFVGNGERERERGEGEREKGRNM